MMVMIQIVMEMTEMTINGSKRMPMLMMRVMNGMTAWIAIPKTRNQQVKA